MKKIFLMLVLFMPFKVFGSSYYTDYVFKERTDKYYEESDILKREEVKLYQNIKKEATFDYIEEKYCDGIVLKDDYKLETLYSNSYIPDYDAVINLKESDYKQVRYIFMYDYHKDENIKDIIVYSNGQKIDIDRLDETGGEVYGRKAYIVIDLKKIYDFKGLSINVVFNNIIESDEDSFTLYFSGTGYKVPFNDIYLNNFYTNKGVSDVIIDVIPDDEYDEIMTKLRFSMPNRSAINYLQKDIYYYRCEKENVIKSDNYTEEALKGYELDYDNYISVYDYYERIKYEALDVIKTKEDIFNLVKGNVRVTNSNIDLNKNGIYEYYVNERKHSVEVAIDTNIKVDTSDNVKPDIIVEEPTIKEKIIYKVINNQATKTKYSDKFKMLNTKCEDTKNDSIMNENINCEECQKCNYKVYKAIIILLCVIILYMFGKNRYILTKGYKL